MPKKFITSGSNLTTLDFVWDEVLVTALKKRLREKYGNQITPMETPKTGADFS